MAITNGQTATATDFIEITVGVADAGKGIRLDENGVISGSLMRRGGDGSDGALTHSSGAQTIDMAGARFFLRQYSSISITGTASVTFINPHDDGTFVLIKNRGDTVLTSSATPMLSVAGCGAAGAAVYNESGGSGSAISNGGDGTNGVIDVSYFSTEGGTNATNSANGTGNTVPEYFFFDPAIHGVFRQFGHRYSRMFVGGGGGQGGGNATAAYNITVAAAGRGGGALAMECAGSWNFTTANGISVAGTNGGNAVINSGTAVAIGGSGGGAAGSFVAVVGSIVANTGTINVSGGIGGNCATVSPGASQGRGGGGGGNINVGNNGANSQTNGNKVGGDGATGISYGVNLLTDI